MVIKEVKLISVVHWTDKNLLLLSNRDYVKNQTQQLFDFLLLGLDFFKN